jgi:voltage-gated potassium channel
MAMESLRARLRVLLDDSANGLGRVVGWVIMTLIVASCIAVAIETLPGLSPAVGAGLRLFEAVTVALFTVEYVLRLASAERPLRKVVEPLLIVDLLAIVPFYVGLFAGHLVDLRILRLLRTIRILRMLKMHRYTDALSMLGAVLRDVRHQLGSFLFITLIAITLMGTVMYHVEPGTFDSIPHAIWWSIVTLTTVGYGETIPQTALGRAVAGGLMLLSIGVVAIPTGIISSGMVEYYHRHRGLRVVCHGCGWDGHMSDARYCRGCGERLGEPE